VRKNGGSSENCVHWGCGTSTTLEFRLGQQSEMREVSDLVHMRLPLHSCRPHGKGLFFSGWPDNKVLR
jgi:hypothetical protein